MNADRRQSNRTLFFKLGAVVVAMFGFGYALVPFYEKICEVTGLRNIARADEVVNTQVDRSRAVRIEFDSNVRKLAWTFKPLHRVLTGQAIPSYGPPQAAQYFRKLECFCFARQTLQPGERRQMPVVFVVDAALPKDVATITLSDTFFEVEGGAGGGG